MNARIAILALAGMAFTAPAYADRMCINPSDIVSSGSKDGKTMIFHMRDGRVLVNHLRGSCPDLRFNGYVWVVHGPDLVCEDEQSLRVMQSGQICILGKFDPPTKFSPATAQTMPR